MPEAIRCRDAARYQRGVPQLTSGGLSPATDVRVPLHGWNKPTEEVGWLLTAMDKTE